MMVMHQKVVARWVPPCQLLYCTVKGLCAQQWHQIPDCKLQPCRNPQTNGVPSKGHSSVSSQPGLATMQWPLATSHMAHLNPFTLC